MPTWNEAAVAQAAHRLHFVLDPRRRRHGSGSRLGQGPGASLEFHDHRSYVAGDDIRHIDWTVYARSDQLVLRRYRVEVSPIVEILLDGSASVDAYPGRFAALCDLAAVLMIIAERDGGRPRLWLLQSTPQRLDPGGPGRWRTALHNATAHGAVGCDAVLPQLSPGSERVILTDGMCPEPARTLIDRLGRGAGRVAAVHMLTAEERDPTQRGPCRLRDPDQGERECVLTDTHIQHYKERLVRHHQSWQYALQGRGAGLAHCRFEDGLASHCQELARLGIVEVRA